MIHDGKILYKVLHFLSFLGFTNCKNVCITKSSKKSAELVDPLSCNTDLAKIIFVIENVLIASHFMLLTEKKFLANLIQSSEK